MKTQTFTHPALYDENDVELKFELPVFNQVCPRCNGDGFHGRTDIDHSRLVDSMEEDGDNEGMEDYKNGGYDVTCETCHGNNVVKSFDLVKFYEENPDMYAKICRYERDAADDRRYAEQERRAGA